MRRGIRRDPGAFRLDRSEAELVELEFEHHLALRTDELVAQGHSKGEARRLAEEAFGDQETYRVSCVEESSRGRRTRGRHERLRSLLPSLHQAMRRLANAKGYALAVVLTLGLGIGANAAIFTVVDAMLLKPIPYPDPDGLFEVHMWYPEAGRIGNVVPRDAARALLEHADLGARIQFHARMSVLFAGGREPATLVVEAITPGLVSALGSQPVLGRSFTPEDAIPGATRVALVGHDFWRIELQADPSAVGREILLDDELVEVVGVMPRGFRFPHFTGTPLWVPLATDLSALGRPPSRALEALVRVDAQNLEPLAARLAAIADIQPLRGPLGEAEPRLVGMNRPVAGEDVARTLWVALGAALTMFLIALVNGVNLSMARATTRAREVAVRLALGASGARVALELLAESLVLAAASAIGAVALAHAGVELLLAIAPASLTYWAPRLIEVDARVLTFVACLAFVATLGFGLLPAAQAVRAGRTLRAGSVDVHVARSRDSQGLRSSLIVAQVAGSLCLLFGAGLLGRSFHRIMSVDLGFEPSGLIDLYIQVPSTRYPTPEERAAQLDRVEERLAALPGVLDLARACCVPPGVALTFDQIFIDGRDEPATSPETVITYLDGAGGDLRRVLGIDLLSGRDPIPAGDGSYSVLVSESLAQRLAPGGSAVDLVFRFGREGQPHRVSGVIGDVEWRGPDAPFGDEAIMYLSEERSVDTRGASFAIRTGDDARALLPAVRAVVAEMDPHQPIDRLATMDDQLWESLASPRFFLTVMAMFAAVAFVLAGLGLHGLLSFCVSQRRHEIGVRIALGASASGVRSLVVGSALRITGMGLMIGMAVSLYGSKAIQGLLFETSRTDILTLVVVASSLGAWAALASYLPARRATSVNPVEVLRHD